MIKKQLLLTGFTMALINMSCGKEDASDVNPSVPNFADSNMEIAYPEIEGRCTTINFEGNEIEVREVNGTYFFEGDIAIPKESIQDVNALKSCGRTRSLWPNGIVYYTVSSSLSNIDRVYDAIEHWEDKTDIRFVKRTNQSNYVKFRSGSGCWSDVGMIGGEQYVTLGDGCTLGSTIHEIGHTLGLWHEHSRVDRDDYVTINYENITSGYSRYFDTYVDKGYDGKEYNSALDISSVMMYGSYYYSKNGRPTITKKDGSTFDPQRSSLSYYDILGISRMYPTAGSGTSTGGGTTTYENGKDYTIAGLTVRRYNDEWWWYNRSTKEWHQVKLVDGTWRYV